VAATVSRQTLRFLWDAFARHPDHAPAVMTPDGRLTAGDIRRHATAVARQLEQGGVPEGAVVALAVPNGLEFLPALLGLALRSCVVALTSPKLGLQGFTDILKHVAPVALLSTLDFATVGRLGSSIDARQVGEHSVSRPIQIRRLSDGRPATTLPPDTAAIKFSSGSTGIAKGICLTASNLETETETVVHGLGVTGATRLIAPVPLFHSYGFDLGVLASLVTGAPLHVSDGFVPRRALERLVETTPAVFLGVPVMYRLLLEGHPRPLPPHRLVSCTAPLDGDTISRFAQAFGVPVCQHYGASEAGAVTLHAPDDVLDHPNAVGRPMRNVTVRITDPEGHEVPAGEPGEVVVSSGAVAAGYVMGAPPRSPFSGGAYAMGDVGVMDRSGLLTIQGRLDDLINVGGFKVAPAEVCRALDAHPAVRESAVTGHRDGRGEMTVYAMVAARTPVTEAELIRHCQERLAEYKVPRRIDVLGELPRGPTGKVRLAPERTA